MENKNSPHCLVYTPPVVREVDSIMWAGPTGHRTLTSFGSGYAVWVVTSPRPLEAL